MIMPRGALKDSGLRSTDAYLTRKAGMFCDVVERLAHSHMEVGAMLLEVHMIIPMAGARIWCARTASFYFACWKSLAECHRGGRA